MLAIASEKLRDVLNAPVSALFGKEVKIYILIFEIGYEKGRLFLVKDVN